MTDQQHPITPPPDLIKQWVTDVATQVARWGADQELEACCEWLDMGCYQCSIALRDARRPKPTSLKGQALTLIDECTDPHGDYLDDNALAIIRLALESLSD